MLPQMTPRQRIRANKLIRRLCANCVDGECIVLDCECPQIISYTLLCKYFKNSVLPVDKELEAEILKTSEVSVCKDCGVPIEKSCNKKQFCDACGKRRHRKVKAEYIRKKRYKCRQIEG